VGREGEEMKGWEKGMHEKNYTKTQHIWHLETLFGGYHSVSYIFCRAMLCKRGLCRHAVSVRPSRSCTCILSKEIKISSKNFHHRVATPF